MTGAYLPGNSTVELREAPVPEPGHGEVLLRMKASTICGSDIRCIYHEHLGKGPEGYQGVIAGHEPCGRIVKTGPGCRRFGAGDRVIVTGSKEDDYQRAVKNAARGAYAGAASMS